MGRTIEVQNLIDAQGIADRLGVAQRQTVDSWMRRHRDFPAPLDAQVRTRLWDWAEVEAWAMATGRLP